MATVNVNDELYEQLAERARKEGKPIDEVVVETLSRGLVSSGQRAMPAVFGKPAEYYLPTFNIPLRPGVALEKLDELYDDNEESINW